METKIELKEFLNFLSTSCKVNVGEDSDEIKNLNDNLNELTSNALMKRLFDDCEHVPHSTPATKQFADGHVSLDHFNEIVDLLKNKLSELLNEGIFDSVLAYIAPKTIRANAKTTKFSAAAGACSENKRSRTPKRKREKKKKVADSKQSLPPKNEVEVEIQVYEEDEGLKRLFKCPQTLLVLSMPYFAEINKGRRLEEMDIMVHCEIATFDWLMKWVKRHSSDASTNSDNIPPKLNFKNVISIMSLANFLKMRPLFQDCLRFCKHNMNNVIKFTPNLSCLKDGVLKKLADLFDNIEVQNLEDGEDRIRSRLFSRLVKSLREAEPETKQGHYASFAYLYSCSNCGKLVNRFSAPHIPCRVQYISVKSNGDVLFKHSRNSTWNIDDHIKSTWTEYKNWSYTYWRLWSQCHFLYCDACCTIYAVAFSDCCPYHPQQPYFNLTEQCSTVSSPIDDNIGRYPCCGSKAIRNETLKIRSGCKLRSHSPRLLTNDDNCIQTIVEKFPELIKIKCSEDDITNFVENFDDIANLDILLKKASSEKEEHGVCQGLLNGPLFDAHLKVIKKYKSLNSWECRRECTNFQNPENSRFDDADLDSTSAGESENSDFSSCDFFTPIVNKSELADVTLDTDNSIEPKQTQNELKPVWTSRYPNRFYNEDNQRDYEEIAFQAIRTVLLQCNDKQKCGSTDTGHEFCFPSGGSYAKIESEWKEARLKALGNIKQSNKT